MDDKIEKLYEGRFLRLIRRGRWEYAERTNCSGAVVIVAVTPEGKVILTEQHRIPMDRRVIELPAGLAGDEGNASEEVAEAAKRELFEETGYEANAMQVVMTGPPSAGLATEQATFVVASGLRKTGAGGGIEHENIVVHEVPLGGVDHWLREKMRAGVLVDPKVYAGLYFASKGAGAAR